VAGIALRQAGFEVRVFERASQLREVGAGITLQINAMLALSKLGIACPIAARGQAIRRVVSRTATGKARATVSLDRIVAELGAPCITLARTELQQELLCQLGQQFVQLGARVEQVKELGNAATLLLADGTTVEADGIVGADGVRSVIRRELNLPTQLKSDYHCWRALCPLPERLPPEGLTSDELPPDEGAGWWGRGAAFGCFAAGRNLAYWYFTERTQPGELALHKTKWTAAEQHSLLLKKTAAWDTRVQRLIERTQPDAIHFAPLHSRPATRPWGRGRVTLLGDAAHPMLPNLGQGGCMAIEDAVVLSRCLSTADTIEQGMRTYEHMRWRRTTRVVQLSQRLAALAHATDALPLLARQLLRWLPASLRERELRKLLSFDPEK